jgi:hypothetical protein
MFHNKLRFNKQVDRNTPITDYDLTARLDIFLNDVFSILGLDFLWNTKSYTVLKSIYIVYSLTKKDRKQLNIFKMKVYKRILGPVYDNEKENWRLLTNKS